VAGGLGLWLVLRPDHNIVATVNGAPVYADELRMYADADRAAVSVSFSKEHNLSATGADFWDTEYDGTTPRQALLDAAMKDAVRNKVIQQAAVARGITAPSDFRNVQQALKERNESQAAGGEYGPADMGIGEYDNYLMAQTIDDLKANLLDNELKPTDADLQAAFDSLDPTYKESPFTVTGWLITPGPDSPAESDWHLDATNFSCPVAATCEEFSLDSANIGREDTDNLSRATALSTATVGDLVPDTGGASIFVTQKTGGEPLTLDQAPQLGRNKWINDQFEVWVDNLVATASVQINSWAADAVIDTPK
jgi:hypothetical protein